MTKRLYYDDLFQMQFEAQVVELTTDAERPAVVLDQTAFYPTAGGQPHDTGTLAGVPVVDVVERAGDGAVLHVLDGPAPVVGSMVAGLVNAVRRFDHMQQHTGQHILSQACLKRWNAQTVGFHLADTYSSIDLDREPREPVDQVMVQVQEIVNGVVFGDLPVRAWFPTEGELAALRLRKPAGAHERIRVVQVEGFDVTACGGTHVTATGQIGLVVVRRWERYKGGLRVEFLCGGRALRDYCFLATTVRDLATELSVADTDLADMVRRRLAEAQEYHHLAEVRGNALLDYEARELVATAEVHGSLRLVLRVYEDRPFEEVRRLALRLTEEPGAVALLAARGDKVQLAFGRGPDLDLDMNAILRAACQVLGGKSGGRPHLAQGGGPDAAHLDEALAVARRHVLGA
ncbi:MAG: alanyl-tRNA editing protein [Chloroflexi bacterium]|nr:alanyl-tRNA editing protein [Chloroflexota bacterium]